MLPPGAFSDQLDSNPDSDSKQLDSDSDSDSRKKGWIRIQLDSDSRCLDSDPDSDSRWLDSHITGKDPGPKKKFFLTFWDENKFSVINPVKETHKPYGFSCFHLILHFGFSHFSIADFFPLKTCMDF